MTENEKEDYLPLSGVKERGWTDSMIRAFLGDPDKTAPNPFYRNAGAPMRLYSLTRVREAETSEQWIAARELASTRSKASHERALRKAKQLVQSVENLSVAVPELSEAELSRQACEHYNHRATDRSFLRDRGDFMQFATSNSDPAFLNRIKVNYLRHEYTIYDEALYGVRKKIGAGRSRAAIRNLVLREIAKVYPALAEECDRQRRNFLDCYLSPNERAAVAQKMEGGRDGQSHRNES